jgi:hypothetical protein
MNLSNTKLRRQLRVLDTRRRALLRRLLNSEDLALGTVSWVERKCGRSGCHCAEGPGHRQLQFLFADAGGTRRCKLIRKADEERLLEANERYRAVRDDLRKLAVIQKREHALLMALTRTRALSYE